MIFRYCSFFWFHLMTSNRNAVHKGFSFTSQFFGLTVYLILILCNTIIEALMLKDNSLIKKKLNQNLHFFYSPSILLRMWLIFFSFGCAFYLINKRCFFSLKKNCNTLTKRLQLFYNIVINQFGFKICDTIQIFLSLEGGPTHEYKTCSIVLF